MSDIDIVTGDCREVLATIGPGSVRLIFADPPYGQGIDYGPHFDDRMTAAEYDAWSREWIAAAVPTLARDGSLWVLCSWERQPRLHIALEDAGVHWRQTIVWYESFGVNCIRKFNRCARPLLWMVRDPRRFVFNRDAVRTRSARQRLGDRRANPDGKILDDVWIIPRLAGTHAERVPDVPTQLPLELVRRVVLAASDPGDLVVDPFAGSGTTAAVCRELGRRHVGIELSAEYAARARQRVAGVTPALLFSA
jgi:site-specific DNA-methyltransferase (adenine-specific)